MRLVGKAYHAAVGTAVFAVIFGWGLYRPHVRQLAAARMETTALRGQVDAGSTTLHEAAELHRQVERAKQNLTGFDAAIPPDDDMGSLLERIDAVAREAGLGELDVVPGTAIEGPKLACRPIDISLSGGFDAIFGFVQRLESLPRIAAVQQLELNIDEESAGKLNCVLTVHVYFRRS